MPQGYDRKHGPRSARTGNTMIVAMLDADTFGVLWQQLIQLWELIVMICRFLWGLLRLLGGA